jgi:hypothetical protein
VERSARVAGCTVDLRLGRVESLQDLPSQQTDSDQGYDMHSPEGAVGPFVNREPGGVLRRTGETTVRLPRQSPLYPSARDAGNLHHHLPYLHTTSTPSPPHPHMSHVASVMARS